MASPSLFHVRRRRRLEDDLHAELYGAAGVGDFVVAVEGHTRILNEGIRRRATGNKAYTGIRVVEGVRISDGRSEDELGIILIDPNRRAWRLRVAEERTQRVNADEGSVPRRIAVARAQEAKVGELERRIALSGSQQIGAVELPAAS